MAKYYKKMANGDYWEMTPKESLYYGSDDNPSCLMWIIGYIICGIILGLLALYGKFH